MLEQRIQNWENCAKIAEEEVNRAKSANDQDNEEADRKFCFDRLA